MQQTTNMSAKQLIVGDPTCEFRTVCYIIDSHPAAGDLYNKWKEFARALRVPGGTIAQLELQVGRPGYTFNTVIYDILSAWRGVSGHDATINVLLGVLEALNLVQIAGAIREHFGLSNLL